MTTAHDDRSPLTDLVSRRMDRPFMVAFAFALGFTLLIALTLGYTALRLVTSANEDRDAARVEAQQVKAQLDANQRETNCIRKLSGDTNLAATNNALAFNEYVIGLGSRGDIPALQAALQQAGQELRATVTVYFRAVTEGVDVARDCPGM